MPSTPRMAMAMPTDLGGRPRPPVKTKGGCRDREPSGADFEGSYTGVDRKTNHSELKVPTWKARKK